MDTDRIPKGLVVKHMKHYGKKLAWKSTALIGLAVAEFYGWMSVFHFGSMMRTYKGALILDGNALACTLLAILSAIGIGVFGAMCASWYESAKDYRYEFVKRVQRTEAFVESLPRMILQGIVGSIKSLPELVVGMPLLLCRSLYWSLRTKTAPEGVPQVRLLRLSIICAAVVGISAMFVAAGVWMDPVTSSLIADIAVQMGHNVSQQAYGQGLTINGYSTASYSGLFGFVVFIAITAYVLLNDSHSTKLCNFVQR